MVAQGNVLMQEGQVEAALAVFQAASGMEADCVEAAYNAGCGGGVITAHHCKATLLQF